MIGIEIVKKIKNDGAICINADINITKNSALNERHYGGLTGLNKDETIKKYGIHNEINEDENLTNQIELFEKYYMDDMDDDDD